MHQCHKSGGKIELLIDVDHLLTCSKGHHRTKRHDDIRDRVAMATAKAGYPTKTEQSLPEVRKTTYGRHARSYSTCRSDVTFIENFRNEAHLDVTITHLKLHRHDHHGPLRAAERAFDSKTDWYRSLQRDFDSDPVNIGSRLPRAKGQPVLPLVLEIIEGFHPSFKAFLKRLACDYESSTAPKYAYQSR